MQPIEIADLCQISSYGRLKCAGKNAVFVRALPSADGMGYDYDLMLFRKGKIIPLTNRKNVRDFVFENHHTLWFVSECKKEGRSQSELFSLSLKGGEAQSRALLPEEGVSLEGFVDETTLLVRYERSIYGDQGEHQEDYEILDEYPWYFNGQGFIGGSRTCLALYDTRTGILKKPFTDDLKVTLTAIDRGIIYFTAPKPQPVQKSLTDRIYRYDPASDRLECLLQSGLDIYSLNAFKGQLLFFGSNGTPIGLNSNPCLYRWSLNNRSFSKVLEWSETLGNTVGTDCAVVKGQDTAAFDGKLYFTGTVVDHNNLFEFSAGSVHQILEWNGTIQSFGFLKGELLWLGAHRSGLQQLYTLRDGKPVQLSDFHHELEEKYIAEVQPVFYTGSQSAQQLGWVLYPRDFDPSQSYPGILDIHGGPKTVYGTVFYHEMQVWASAGYFVFFCNPFGSDGQGNDYADLRGKYGTDDYRDLMSFTDAVLQEIPQLDPERLGVTGGSYGGFMTNWIVTHTDRFKAAAAQRSISNWVSFLGTSDIGLEFAADQQGSRDPDVLWEHSPLRYAANAKTPLLLIHSDQDYRCPLEQGLQMLSAVLDNGTEAKLVLFHGENHELSRSGKPAHRIRRLTEITRWMDSHLKETKNETEL